MPIIPTVAGAALTVCAQGNSSELLTLCEAAFDVAMYTVASAA
jgi:hypothetical protein